MEVKLSSNNFDIIASGETFLPNEWSNLTIQINGQVNACVIIEFLSDSSNESKIDRKVVGDCLVLYCYNFNTLGKGLIKPLPIAEIENRELQLIFWTYLEGNDNSKIRRVKYTFFYEK